jgi:phage shock protein A
MNGNSNSGNVKAEAAALLAEERRAKRVWDECLAEIDKLQRYAEKSVLAGDDASARKFLEKKVEQEDKEAGLKAAYERAAASAARLQPLQNQATPSAAHSEHNPPLTAQEKWAAIKAKRDRE